MGLVAAIPALTLAATAVASLMHWHKDVNRHAMGLRLQYQSA